MAIEKSQIKFTQSETTGELIGFVSRHSKTKKLKGVRENSVYGKKICVLSEELKGTITENVLYNVELKSMHRGNGYVVVSATPAKFAAQVDTVIVPKSIYQVCVTFGNKTIYFDPKDGKSVSSKEFEGALKIIKERKDIEDRDRVIKEFTRQSKQLIQRMETDGYLYHRKKVKP